MQTSSDIDKNRIASDVFFFFLGGGGVRRTVYMLKETNLRIEYVVGFLHHFNVVSQLLDSIYKAAHVPGAIVEHVKPGHCGAGDSSERATFL